MIRKQSRTDEAGTIISYPSFLMENNASFRFFDSLEIPVIAAIRGVCLGSALELALFCHVRLCGDGAVFALPETTFGLVPGCGGIQKVIGRAGMAKGLEIILGGMNFSAGQAREWNIVDRVVPKKEVVDRALLLAEKISSAYDRKDLRRYLQEFMPEATGDRT